jgi:hypothetical protein
MEVGRTPVSTKGCELSKMSMPVHGTGSVCSVAASRAIFTGARSFLAGLPSGSTSFPIMAASRPASPLSGLAVVFAFMPEPHPMQRVKIPHNAGKYRMRRTVAPPVLS